MKKAAVDIVRDLTGSEDGLHSLSNYANTVLPSLSRLLSDDKVFMFLQKNFPLLIISAFH